MTSLHATLRAALAQGYRSGTGWGGHPDGLDGATAAVVAWLGEDAQVKAAARRMYAVEHPHSSVAWEDYQHRDFYLGAARAALGALTHHEETP